MAEVYAGLSALKAAFDLAKGLKEIDDVTRRNTAISELLDRLISAQVHHLEMLETVSDMKKQIARFEAWDAEKQRYVLRDISDGKFAYVIEPSMQGEEPAHAICPTCCQKREKSILQCADYGSYVEASCPACGLTINFDPKDARAPIAFKTPR